MLHASCLMTMFDTHAHLNFSRFRKNIDEVIASSKSNGVSHIVIPGTDVESSAKAVEIAQANEGIYAAVGIHPHHVYQSVIARSETTKQSHEIAALTAFARSDKVVAIGEIGLDRHVYQDTKYENYHIDERFMELQKELFVAQLKLAVQYKKSVIVHNREAKNDILPLLTNNWDPFFEGHMVFHCCEPDAELLEFAKEHKMFIGIDGDVTYREDKQEFIKTVPLDMLVLETDSPFLLPEPLRTQKKFPNTPANLPMIAEFIATLRNENVQEFAEITTQNALRLFML